MSAGCKITTVGEHPCSYVPHSLVFHALRGNERKIAIGGIRVINHQYPAFLEPGQQYLILYEFF